MTQKMNAITIKDNDTKDLHWTEVQRPSPGPNEVLIKAQASAVNRADLVQRFGNYPPPKGASTILGLEIAGVVVSVGENVEKSMLNKRVCALLSGGGYAQYATVDASQLYILPDEMSFATAAAFPEVFTTAYVNLVMEAGGQKDQTLLLHAAASGVGTAVIQLCNQMGIKVFGTASGSKLEQLNALGIHRAIDRHKTSFAKIIEEETEGGVDMIIDPVGADYLDNNIKSLKRQGTLVSIGLLSGRSATLNMGLVLVKRLKIKGSVLRGRTLEEKKAIAQNMQKEVWPLFANGQYEAIIHKTFPIQEAQRAHELVSSNTTVGKVILTF